MYCTNYETDYFKQHPIYQEYFANSQGEVLHIIKNGIVKTYGYKCDNGYRILKVRGRKVPYSRFVYECFNGLIPEGLEIDHINTIRDDNRICNLRAVTSKENHLNPLTREHMRNSKRTTKPVYKIDPATGTILDKYESARIAGEKNNLTESQINHIYSCCKTMATIGGFRWRYAD